MILPILQNTSCSFKIYYKTTIIKMVWCWWKDKHISQSNDIEYSEIDPQTANAFLIFNNDVRAI